MDPLTNWLGRSGWLPHGYCFTWDAPLLWTMVGADALIALSYYSIPAALIVLVRRRGDFELNWVAVLFSLFIFACGTTHVMDVWTIWQPDYTLQAGTKVVTAVASVGTALALWPLLPKAIAIPSVRALQEVVDKLEAEIAVRRRAELDLAQARGGLQLALAALDAGFILADRQGRIVQMNAVAEAVTGWTLEQARDQPIARLWQREDGAADRPAADADGLHAFLAAQRLALGVAQFVRLQSRDGRVLPLLVTASLVDGHGEPTGLALMFRDRSQALQAEADNARLAALVDSSADAIIGASLDGVIRTWNRGAEAMFGHSADEAIGRHYAILLPPGAQGPAGDPVAQVARDAHPEPIEAERRAKDGSLRIVSERVSPVEDGQGNVMGVACILRDISAQKRAEQMRADRERLLTENQRILEASRMKNEFVANMSHELRTPLNSIIGFSVLLGADDGRIGPEQRRQFLGYISSGGQHLLRLINDILDLSKVESGTFEYFPEPVDLRALAEGTAAVLKPAAATRGVRMRLEVAPGLDGVSADPARLKQVIYNYLSNAIKFSRPGGEVRVRLEPEGDTEWRLEVADDGIGISRSGLTRLFVEFQQLDTGAGKRHQGTGLGLALTRKLVEAQGGKVGARSRLGHGSTFYAVLPRAGREIRVEARETTPAELLPLDNPRLLVVDEDDEQRLFVSRRGVEAGFDVVEASLAEALEMAETRSYDALALGAPVDQALCRQLLDTVRTKSPIEPVAMLVMPSQPPMAFCVHDILGKPLDVGRLAAALGRLGLLDGGEPRVLVVDDEAASREMMSGALAERGLVPEAVASAAEALEHVTRRLPQAIVLDLMLPGMDGFELLEALRRLPEGRDVPVIVWTGITLTSADHARLARASVPLAPRGSDGLLGVLKQAAAQAVQRRGTPHEATRADR